MSIDPFDLDDDDMFEEFFGGPKSDREANIIAKLAKELQEQEENMRQMWAASTKTTTLTKPKVAPPRKTDKSLEPDASVKLRPQLREKEWDALLTNPRFGKIMEQMLRNRMVIKGPHVWLNDVVREACEHFNCLYYIERDNSGMLLFVESRDELLAFKLKLDI